MDQMPSRKKNIAPITNKISRRNTKSKRTKCIVKKCRELSILCDLDINVTMYDRSLNQLRQFSTRNGFTAHDICEIIREGQE